MRCHELIKESEVERLTRVIYIGVDTKFREVIMIFMRMMRMMGMMQMM